MELTVLLWILGGGFAGTWGLCIFFMSRTDNGMLDLREEFSKQVKKVQEESLCQIKEIKNEVLEIRKEVSELYHCVKDHHGRLCAIEERNRK